MMVYGEYTLFRIDRRNIFDYAFMGINNEISETLYLQGSFKTMSRRISNIEEVAEGK